MMAMNHFLSEACVWITFSEFVDPQGRITKAEGESVIEIQTDHISNTSWVLMDNLTRENNYRIIPLTNTHYSYQSINPELGIQKGTFDIDRNIVYSKFVIENTQLHGFEIVVRDGDTCNAHGALYDKDILINTWNAVLKKKG